MTDRSEFVTGEWYAQRFCDVGHNGGWRLAAPFRVAGYWQSEAVDAWLAEAVDCGWWINESEAEEKRKDGDLMADTLKPWLKQPGECHDNKGLPIYPGDLLRTPHFRGPRRKQYYLYHVVVLRPEDSGLRMVGACKLDPGSASDPDCQGGDPLLSDDMAAAAEIIDGRTIGEWLRYDERPKKRKDGE